MLQRLIHIMILVLFCAVAPLHAQIGKGNHYFRNKQYAKAIPAYEKGLKKKQDVQAMENLANCYRITRNYKKAEEWYGKTTVANPNCSPMVYFYYGMSLRANGKTAEAKEQFKNYLGKDPQNKAAKAQVEAVDEMKVWLEQTPIYDVRPISDVNTENSEISPVIYSGELYFTSDRGDVDMLYGENEGATNRAYYSVYKAKTTYQKEDSVRFGKTGKISKTINQDYHNGPVSFSGDGNLIAFTRVDRTLKLKSNKKFANRPKIYFASRKGKSWGSVKPFPFNSDEYSVAHPSLSADGKSLYFTSDMPGGSGGNDIWMSTFDGTNWTQPVNLGPTINTPGNEVFPYMRKDGVLYFSSDGHPGLGALDIFTTTKDAKGWSDPVNQGMPLNGTTDDFAPTFNEDLSRGYFSSDRSGGAGSDDIYAFKVTSKFIRISGKVLASKNNGEVMKNTTVELLSADGKLLKTTTTDANGNFKFENLSSDQSYIVRMNESDPSVASKPKYFMTDEKNNLVRVTVMNEFGGKYTFQNLPVDPAAPPQLLSDDDYLTIAGNLISDGQPPQPIANSKVYLKDDQGNLVQQTTTNEFGAFAFTRIPPDKTYVVGMDVGLDPKLAASSKISITNKSGKELMSTRPDGNGKFSFRIIPEDKATLSAMSVDDTELRMDMRGKLVGADEKGTALANTKVNILDEKGQVLQTAVTDDNGDFTFINLPADKAYLMSVDEVADPSLVGLGKIYIKDATGKIIRTLKMNGGKFEFRIIPLDRKTLGTVYVEDPWLQVLQMKHKQQQDTLLIIENIYYDYGDFKILPAAEITLEKVVKVMQMDPSITIEVSAHTDSRSTNDYNQKLSQKRAQAAVDYLVKRGIDKKRLIAIGYGETKLLNQCKDGVECPEEEHAKNRRTEFKINRTKL